MKKYVLTGGPSVGKTTIIEILASRGYKIVPEAARIVIEEERVKGSDALPSKNFEKFQQYVAEKQIDLESKVEGDAVFFDRGIIDGYAYCKYRNIQPPQQIIELGRGRYDKIFLLDSLGMYVEDGVRSRSLEDAVKIHQHIKEVYEEFGYDLVHVPVFSPEERVDFILNNL
jgi:predicted ATPase